MIKKIQLPFKVSGTEIKIPFRAVCSITDKQFRGEVRIVYRPVRAALEYVDTEIAVKKICRQALTAEELANFIFVEVRNSIHPSWLCVTVDVQKSAAHKPVVVWIDSR
ncbi:MAG: hypothetical protein WCT27_02515 [Patescibacteria group bacterium]